MIVICLCNSSWTFLFVEKNNYFIQKIYVHKMFNVPNLDTNILKKKPRFWSHCPVLINPVHLSWQRADADAQADCSVPSWWVETTHCHFCVHVSFPAISRGSWLCSMNKWWGWEKDRDRASGRESRMMGRESRNLSVLDPLHQAKR